MTAFKNERTSDSGEKKANDIFFVLLIALTALFIVFALLLFYLLPKVFNLFG